MAQRRMFNKSITNSDTFMEMPQTSQNLYFHLSMNADDDGFVDNWKAIMRMTGNKEDDLKVLIAKSYIIPFESGVIVIKHWRLNNYLQADRKLATIHQEELKSLDISKNGQYFLKNPINSGINEFCIHSIDKYSIDKNSIEYKESIKKFIKPTIEEIEEYCKERKNGINANVFYDFYESKNWYVGKNKMKDWKACIRTWEQRSNKNKTIEKNVPDWFNKEIKKEEGMSRDEVERKIRELEAQK